MLVVVNYIHNEFAMWGWLATNLEALKRWVNLQILG
jgi:hypothetical protein